MIIQDIPRSSESLFHYTPTKENLKSILQAGFKTNYVYELIPFSFVKGVEELTQEELTAMPSTSVQRYFELRGNSQAKDYTYIPMVSFCDIPPELSDAHRKIYGKYGIGLSKSWVEEIIGLNPIIYMTDKSRLLSYFNNLWTRISLLDLTFFYRPLAPGYSIRSTEDIKEQNTRDSHFQLQNLHTIASMCREIICHVKPYEGYFKHGSYENPNHRFYDEREWRYTPPIVETKWTFFNQAMPEDLRASLNVKLQLLRIDLPSISQLIVNSKNEVKEFKDYLCELQATICKKFNPSKIKFISCPLD